MYITGFVIIIIIQSSTLEWIAAINYIRPQRDQHIKTHDAGMAEISPLPEQVFLLCWRSFCGTSKIGGGSASLGCIK